MLYFLFSFVIVCGMKKMYIVLAWATVMILGSSGASAYSASADESIVDDSVIGGAFADESVVTPSNNCVDVQFIFARGSGATRHESDE